MDEKPKTPRHMMSLTPTVFTQLADFKQELEKQMQFKMTFSQVVAWLLVNHKEIK